MAGEIHVKGGAPSCERNMAVIGPTFLGGYQPVCGECGIALCWELAPQEYEEQKEYWDNWSCENCDPYYFSRWTLKRRLQHEREKEQSGKLKENP